MSDETGGASAEVSAVSTDSSTNVEQATSGSSAESSNQSQGNIESGAEGAVAPAYTPNFKFKYLDADGKTRQEKEFDAWAKGVVKDQETEKRVRELYEKAHGLDYAKVSRDRFRGESETLRSEVENTKTALGKLSGFVQSGDMQSFFEALKIPEDKVLQYALNRVQYRELPPEKRAEYDQMRSAQQRASYLEEQNRQLYQQFEQTQVQTRQQELSRSLSDPNVAQVAEAFDQRVGRPGAFQTEVIRRGQYYNAVLKQDISAEQAVQEVLNMIGGIQPQQQQATPSALPAGGHTPEKIVPVIPNIQGRGTSPAKKMPRSIADLKKLAYGE